MNSTIDKLFSKHFYELCEVRAAREQTARWGDVVQKGFWDVETDLSKNGKDVWTTNLSLAVTDIGLANPTLVVYLLICYNRWFSVIRENLHGDDTQSYLDEDARRMLICSGMYVSTSKKSRIVSNVALASQTLSKEEIENEANNLQEKYLTASESIASSVQWAESEKLNVLRSVSEKMNDEIREMGFDLIQIVGGLTGFMMQTMELWSLYKTELNEEMKIELYNKAIQSEKMLVFMALLIYSAEVVEQRRVGDMKPLFLENVLSEMRDMEQDGITRISIVDLFIKLNGIVSDMNDQKKCDKVTNQPCFWVWSLLYQIVREDESLSPKQKYDQFSTLGSLHEIFCRIPTTEDSSPNYVAAILYVARRSLLDFDLNKNPSPALLFNTPEFKKIYDWYIDIDPHSGMHSTSHANYMQLYMSQGNNIHRNRRYDFSAKQESSNTETQQMKPMSSEWLIKRRAYEIVPSFIDKKTVRARKNDTHKLFVDNFNKAAIDNWPSFELDLLKSHGPGIKYKKSSAITKKCSWDGLQIQNNLNVLDTLPKISGIEHYIRYCLNLNPLMIEGGLDSYRDDAYWLLLTTERESTTVKTNFKNILHRTRIFLLENNSLCKRMDIPKEIFSIMKKKNETLLSSRKKIQKYYEYLKQTTEKNKMTSSESEHSESPQNENTSPLIEQKQKNSKRKNLKKEKKPKKADKKIMDTSDDEENPLEEFEKKKPSKKRSRKQMDDVDEKENTQEKVNKKEKNSGAKKTKDPPAKKRKTSDSKTLDSKKKVEAKKKSVKSKVTSIDEKFIQLLNKNATVELDFDPQTLPLIVKPSSNTKKFLFMSESYIYKGPYNADSEKDITTLMNILYKHRILSMIGDKTLYEYDLVRVVDLKSDDPIDCESNSEEAKTKTKQFYIRLPNYSSPVDVLKFEKRMITVNLKTHEKQTVKVFPTFHTTVATMKQLNGTPLFDQLLPQMTESLLYRYLMAIGDSHLENYIVCLNDDRLVQLDIDDNRVKSIPTYLDVFEEELREEDEKKSLKEMEIPLNEILFTKQKMSVEMDQLWAARSKNEQQEFIDSMLRKLKVIAEIGEEEFVDREKFHLNEFFIKEDFQVRLKTLEYVLKRWSFDLNELFEETPQTDSDEGSTSSVNESPTTSEDSMVDEE